MVHAVRGFGRIRGAIARLVGVLLATLGVAGAAGATTPYDPCALLGVLSAPTQEVRFFAVDLKHGTTAILGQPLARTAVAGVAVHPSTGVLYALLAPQAGAKTFSLATVDRGTGAVTSVGSSGLTKAAGLSIRPTDGSLWTWADGKGPAQLATSNGAASVKASSKAVVTDLAWSPDGAFLYAAGGRVLHRWSPADGTVAELVKLPLTVAGMTMRADGRLLFSAPRPQSGTSGGASPGLDRGFSLLTVDPASGRVDGTLAAPPIPLGTLPAVAAAVVESLTWPLSCGNPSPGGPADLIRNVSVEPASVCPGGSAQITVQVVHPEGGTNPVNVTIGGFPGDRRWVQFEGKPGPRTVTIGATTAEGYYETEKVSLEVLPCDPSAVSPVLRIRPDPYRLGVADLEVQNAEVVAPSGSVFRWEFGDGTSAEGDVPFARHSYAASLARDVEFPTFHAAVTVARPDSTSVTTLKTVAFWNRYAADRRWGVIRPPVETEDVGPLAEASSPMIRSLLPPSAGYTVRNVEDRPIRLTGRQVEHQYCDPERRPLFSSWAPLDLQIEPGASVEQRVTLPGDEEICGVGVHLIGTADVLHRVAVDVYFETRRNSLKTSRVTDGALLDALNAAASVLPNSDRVLAEDLFQLWREKRIPKPEGGPSVPPPPDPEPDPYLGQACMQGDPPPYDGISCQATDTWIEHDKPHIRNALKGDAILSTVCGLVGSLLRAVHPPQYYSHSGIMTNNHYAVAHSTASSDRFLAYPEGGGELTEGVREDVMRYGWPGVLRQSVEDAFRTVHMTDPNGASFELHGFSQNPAQCPEDEVITYPMVVRPPADQAAAVRPLLEQAADIAHDTQPGNYRFYAYSDTGIGLSYDPPFYYYGPAEMCSGFVWRSLTLAGAHPEGPQLEPEDVQNGASLDAEGLLDGLYAYDVAERLDAGQYIHDSITEQVETAAGWFGDALTDAADDLANQFTNCFASDWCGGGSKDSEAWAETGGGRAASPQDMFYWDSPATGGVYGSHEPLVYRSGGYEREYRWGRSEGAGDIRGTVKRDGVGVEGARVVLYADVTRETQSGADGSFSFLGVASGNYEVEAQKLDGNILLEANGVVAVPAGGTGNVTLTLKPPPEYLRRLIFQGTYEITDDDAPDSDTLGTGNFYEECRVDPYVRQVSFQWPPSYTEPYCVGGEVLPIIDVTCVLLEDNTTVQWYGTARLFEQTDCDPTDEDGRITFETHQLSKGHSLSWNIHLVNEDEVDASDEAWFWLNVTNELQP